MLFCFLLYITYISVSRTPAVPFLFTVQHKVRCSPQSIYANYDAYKCRLFSSALLGLPRFLLRRSGLDDREIDEERKGRKHLTWEDEAGGKVKYDTSLVSTDEFKCRRYLETTVSFCFRRKEMQTRLRMHSPLF
jgi:hypothetical protein